MSFNNIPTKLKELHQNILEASTKEIKIQNALELKEYIENYVIPTIELVFYCEDLIKQ